MWIDESTNVYYKWRDSTKTEQTNRQISATSGQKNGQTYNVLQVEDEYYEWADESADE